MDLTKIDKPMLMEGGLFVDDRGSLSFVNNFDFSGVKRFYCVDNFSTATVRAFHGHQKEGKFVFVTSGDFIVAAVKMDDIKNPSKGNEVFRFVLSDRKPCVVFIPAGFANGFRALSEKNKVIFFSTSTLEESKGDDFRFPADYWGSKVWEAEDR